MIDENKYFEGGQTSTLNINEAKKYDSFRSVAADFESGDGFIVLMNEDGSEKARFDWNEHIRLRDVLK
ncbi:MAG: hypothetical protein WCL23_03370 [Candidatus Moraniibacteriota bacterium]